MKKAFKNTILSLAALGAGLFSVLTPQIANAVDPAPVTGGNGGSGKGINVFSNCSNGSGVNNTTSGGQICGASQQDDFSKLMQNVINLLLLVLGMIAVIAIIIGGVRYTTSNGDPGQIKSAKDTILYAVIGLVVAIMAYAIVGFVIAAFKK